jgi:hypothetical protein
MLAPPIKALVTLSRAGDWGAGPRGRRLSTLAPLSNAEASLHGYPLVAAGWKNPATRGYTAGREVTARKPHDPVGVGAVAPLAVLRDRWTAQNRTTFRTCNPRSARLSTKLTAGMQRNERWGPAQLPDAPCNQAHTGLLATHRASLACEAGPAGRNKALPALPVRRGAFQI